jgi:STE24 endopeptidase
LKFDPAISAAATLQGAPLESAPSHPAVSVSIVFAAVLLLSVALRLWLTLRQIRHVALHRGSVPTAFEGTVSLASHQRAADYTLDKARFSLWSTGFSAAVLLGWTLLGGLDSLNTLLLNEVAPRWGGMAYQLSLLTAFALLSSLIELPLELYATFVLEQKHGFNRMNWQLFLSDSLKGLLMSAALGLPLAAGILWIMGALGDSWWFWAWAAWMSFSLVMMWVYPSWIAPLFNRFEPLQKADLAERAAALMTRCGFQSKGFFVMDGSRRSAHGNAYFTGLGSSKRVVFFDTLLDKLSVDEVEAVLAHELGHFKHRHILQRMVWLFAASLLGFMLLGWLSTQSAFYQGLGVTPALSAPNHAMALLLLGLALPVFSFFLTPVGALLSRRHEFQADAYACEQSDGRALSSALLKLHQDNASSLSPDPWFARFYYSHPPAVERLAAIAAQPAPRPVS